MKLGPLDYLPPAAQHLVLMLAASVLGWLARLLPILSGHRGAAAAAILGPLLALLVVAATKLTRQYGHGTGEPMPPLAGASWHDRSGRY